jgi:hypothetical protein
MAMNDGADLAAEGTTRSVTREDLKAQRFATVYANDTPRRDCWNANPRPAKPISIVAQVEGSGAEATAPNGAKGFSDDLASVVDAEGISADGPRYPR